METLVLFRNLWFRLAAQLKLMLPSATTATAGTTTVTASRIADIIAMIDEHTIAGTMTGKQVIAFYAMINAHCHEPTTAPRCSARASTSSAPTS
jgi:hypothetical protein